MSRFMSAEDVVEIKQFLSVPRLGTYITLVKSQNPEDAIELHQVTMSLGIAIMAVTGLIEVSLRNIACKELDISFGGEGWLRSPPDSLKWAAFEKNAIKTAEKHARRAVYSKMDGATKSGLDALAFPNGVPLGVKHRKLAEKRQATIQVTDSQVIAQLTMNFWKRLFSVNYEKTLWKRGLKRTFPNKRLSRADIAAYLEVIYETRNRLAHHEPVYGRRLESILAAIEFTSSNLGSVYSGEDNSFSKLIRPQTDILAGQVAVFKATFNRLC
jgi:hypothetical protein